MTTIVNRFKWIGAWIGGLTVFVGLTGLTVIEVASRMHRPGAWEQVSRAVRYPVPAWCVLILCAASSVISIVACFANWQYRRPPQPWQSPSRKAALAALDETLASPARLHGRMKDHGHPGWIHQDLVSLISAFRRAIMDFSPPDGHFRTMMDEIGRKYAAGDADAKLHMLELRGVVEDLRKMWSEKQV